VQPLRPKSPLPLPAGRTKPLENFPEILCLPVFKVCPQLACPTLRNCFQPDAQIPIILAQFQLTVSSRPGLYLTFAMLMFILSGPLSISSQSTIPSVVEQLMFFLYLESCP
jgi:hypothetical protein